MSPEIGNKTIRKLFQTKLIAPLLLLISACGGGETEKSIEAEAINKAPSIQISVPGTNTSFAEEEVITFTASANDEEDGDISNSIEWLSSQDGVIGTGSQINTNLSVGSHLITASVDDSEGKSDSESINIEVTLVIAENSPPNVTIDSPNNNASFVGPTSVSFTGSASDNEDGVISQNIEWTSSIEGVLGSGASIVAQLSVGTHSISASILDSDGSSGSESISIIITAAPPENTAPGVAINSPTNNSSFEENNEIAFNASAEDAEDGDLSANIVWRSNLDGEIGVGASISSSLTVGSHQVTATVTDSGELSSSVSINLIVEAEAQNTAPTLTISSPSQNSTFEEGSEQVLSATADDVEDGDISQNIQWSSNIDGALGSGANLSVSLSAGSHELTASVADSEAASASQTVSVRINLLPTADAGEEQTVDENVVVELSAIASDEDGSIATYQWLQTGGESVSLANDMTQTASFTSPTVPQGVSSLVMDFELTVTDNHGGIATDSVSVTVLVPGDVEDCDLTINPGDSFESSFAQMSAGDTLCLNSGRYQQAMDIPSNMHVRAVTDGMAEIDGGSTLGIDWQGGLVTLRGSNSSVRGLRVHHASTYASACSVKGSSNTLKAMSCAHGGSYKHSIPMSIGGTGHLIEDSWFFGEGRYVVQCFRGSNITIRRNVIRWDETAPNEPSEPNAAMSNYSCSDMIWENNISLDYGLPETYMVYCGDMCMSSNVDEPNERVKYLGNMVVNHHPDTGNNRAFRADQKGSVPSNDITIQDFYIRSVGRGIIFNSIYENITMGNCTMIDVDAPGSIDGTEIQCNNDADVSVRYVDGVKTSEPLFPFEFEALIKRDLCASGERQSEWCSSTKSLEDYLLNQ